jgi:hypothetical protein
MRKLTSSSSVWPPTRSVTWRNSMSPRTSTRSTLVSGPSFTLLGTSRMARSRCHEVEPRWTMLAIQPRAMRGHWIISKRNTNDENWPIVRSPPSPSTSRPPTSSSSEIVRPNMSSISGKSGPSAFVNDRLRRMNSSLSRSNASTSRDSIPNPLTTRIPEKFSCAIDGDVRELLLDALVAAVHHPQQQEEGDRDEGDDRQREQAEADVELEHAEQREAEHQAGVRAHHDGDADQHAHGVEVGREARHEVAHPVVVVVRRVQPREVVEQVVTDVELDLPGRVQQDPADDDHGAAAGQPMPKRAAT